MQSGLRAALKRRIPTWTKELVRDLRSVTAAPPIDDVVLAQYRFAQDLNGGVRLNFIIPNLTASLAFGGVTTGLDIFLKLALQISAKTPVNLRVILAEPDQATDPTIFTNRAETAGFPLQACEVFACGSNDCEIPVRARDIFVSFNVWMTLNLVPLLEEQMKAFEQPRLPLVFLIQEYEPHMYPFSSAHLLAREAYDRTERLWGVFNSSNLHNFYQTAGHAAERAFLFEPVISEKLRPHLVERVQKAERSKRILVYGRPTIARNCFPAIQRGLRRWAADYPEFQEWEVVSAGTQHKPLELGDGRALTSLGKLSLEDYAQLLLSSSVGLSLMSSPHPSYPPLEMAHMGLQVVTNGYQCKDLSTFHPAILSLDSISDASLANGLAEACRNAEKTHTHPHNPSFVRAQEYPFIADLADGILQEVKR